MHEAVIHIGTEKTGSTAIQNFLFKNEIQLANSGIYFPFRTCGLISNFRLVLYSLNTPDPALVRLENTFSGNRITDTESYDNWKDNFSKDHGDALKNIQKNRDSSLVVYSSEHFHSRVRNENELENLKEFLTSYFDRIRIIFYARRQDRLAMSAYNTSIQGGESSFFDFKKITTSGPYYDYLALAQLWSGVFGVNNVQPAIYERSRLEYNDVVKDFESRIGVNKSLLEHNTFIYEKSNERLSYSALSALTDFNLLKESDERLLGFSKASVRQDLIAELHGIEDEYGEVLPPRTQAIEFYEHYKERNRVFADTWLDGHGFSKDFTLYPDTNLNLPDVDGGKILDSALAICLKKNNAHPKME